MPRHRLDQFLRRRNILDLDALDLDAPRRCRGVDHREELGVDAIALRQQLVEVHRAHHGANIGHYQIADCELHVGNLIGGLRRVQQLVEDDGIDRHDGVVAGDDALRGDLEHRLHHVHFRPNLIDTRNNEGKSRLEGAYVTAESLDRPLTSLGNPLDRNPDKNQGEQDNHQHKDREGAEHDRFHR